MDTKANEVRKRFEELSAFNTARLRFYETIRASIMDGVLLPGETLSEGEVARWLDLSRTPVREGLQRLEAEGWLIRSRSRGIVVSDVSTRDLSDLYAMRRVLEGLAVSMGVPVTPRKQDVFKRMEWLMEEMQLHTRRNDAEAVAEKNKEFHLLLVSLCGSKVLMSTLKGIYDQLERVREGGLWGRGRLKAAQEEHTAIFAAVAEGDAEAARERVEKHIARAAQAVLDRLTTGDSADRNP